MKHLILVIGLVVLCIQQGCWSFRIPSASSKGQQLLYSYQGRIDTGSSASDERLSRWGVIGNLTMQYREYSIVLQLQDLQTTIFNGLREDMNNHENQFEKIPEEVAILEQPFIVNLDFTLSVAQNEPLWSVNFKRGVAGNLHEVMKGINQEKFVYGLCETNTISKDGEMIKTVNHDKCENADFMHLTNVRPAPAPEGSSFSPIQRKTVINIKFPPGQRFPPESITTDSVLTYTSMPKIPYNQYSRQQSALNLISTTTEFEPIDTSKITENRDMFFEYGTETTQGRHKYENDSLILEQHFFKSYASFETLFEQTPLENRKNTTEDPVEDMYLALYNMPDEPAISYLREKILSKHDKMMYDTFLSLLSYVGTEQAVEAINKMISKSELLKTEYSGLKLLATFPNYIREATEELVQSLEGMLELQNVKLESIRNAQILSFASVVDRAYQQNHLSAESLSKYQTIYFDKFIESESYESKMLYLLGLVNMAEALSFDFKVSIITNTSLPANLRSLAIAGFKNTLKTVNSHKLFGTFWRIVVNNEENFDVRIESLDLLLSADLSEDQFNTILIGSMKIASSGIYGLHLLNYVVTTLESIQNKTAYREPLSNLATEAIQNKQFPIYPREFWQTGNYRLSYSDEDPNLGAYIQARLIGLPETASFSTVQFSYSQFAWSFNTGIYSVYMKVQGITELGFIREFFSGVNEDTVLFQLQELVTKFKYQMKEAYSPIHVDIVVFIDDKAVYAMSLDQENMNDKEKVLGSLIEESILDSFQITYPVMDYTHIPSLLGTPLSIKNDMQYIEHLSFIHNDFLYRLSWYYQTWLESYNPILDTTLSSFKYYGSEIGIRTKLGTNLGRMILVWATKNDTFNWATDKLIGTNVDNEKLLHRFCPICEGVTEVPTNINIVDYIKNSTYLGTKYNHTMQQHETLREKLDFYVSIKDTYQSNTDAIPFVQPLLALIHTLRYTYHLKPDTSRHLFRSIEVKEGGVQTRMRFEENTDKPFLTVDPYVDTHTNYSWTIVSKDFDEPDLVEHENYNTFWQILLEFKSTHNFTDENGKPKVKFTQNLYFVTDNKNGSGTDEIGSTQIISSRVELLPPVNPNRFSISPPEDGTALNIIRQYRKNKDNEYGNNVTVTFTEVYTTNEELTKSIMSSTIYKQCLKDSKGFTYTPPTNSCYHVFLSMSRYDKYTSNMKTENTNVDAENLATTPILTYETVDYDKLKYSLYLAPILQNDELPSYWNSTIYYPYKSRNPIADINRDNDLFRGIKRSCIISPKEIRTFAFNYIPNTNTNIQVALVECIQFPRRAINFKKISNNQIDVEFISRNYVVKGTANGNKLQVTLNGVELQESHVNVNEKISIRFLDENTVYIADDLVGIYYNTEYIYIKTKPLYKNVICGLCDA